MYKRQTDYVVIEGNPEDGWTVVNWNGQQLGAKPTLGAEVQLQVRTLTRQLAASAKQVVDAFATLNPAKIVAAIAQGSVAATYSIAKFARAVNAKLVQERAVPAAVDSATQSVEDVSTLNAAESSEATTTTSTARAVTGTVTGKPVKTPSAAPKLEAIESPNGATDLKDGNKAVPGAGSVEQRDDNDGEKAATETDDTDAEPDAATDADSADAGEDGSQQSDAA